MRVLVLASGLSGTRAALVAVVTGAAWHIWYAWLEILCRIDVTHQVTFVDFGRSDERASFRLSLSIACFSAGRLCRLSGRRRLVGGLGSVGCRWIGLGGMIGT